MGNRSGTDVRYAGINKRILELLELRTIVHSLSNDGTLSYQEEQIALDQINYEIKSLLQVLDKTGVG